MTTQAHLTTPTEIANPAAVGWRYFATYDDASDGPTTYEHEITWIRGTDHLHYGTKNPEGRWITTPITNPERFGFDGTLKGARAAVTAFLAS